jgi:hypothetical protein
MAGTTWPAMTWKLRGKMVPNSAPCDCVQADSDPHACLRQGATAKLTSDTRVRFWSNTAGRGHKLAAVLLRDKFGGRLQAVTECATKQHEINEFETWT